MDLAGLSLTDKKEKILSGIAALRETLGVTETLGNLGVTKQDIPSLARNAMHDPCMATNPRRPTLKDIERIYEEAL
jgi:alcohol dehydrogenase class IV